MIGILIFIFTTLKGDIILANCDSLFTSDGIRTCLNEHPGNLTLLDLVTFTYHLQHGTHLKCMQSHLLHNNTQDVLT